MSDRASGYALGHMTATVVLLIAPIALGYWASKRLTAKREGYEPVRWPIAVGCAFSAFILMGQCSQHRADASPRTEVASIQTDAQKAGAANAQNRLAIRGFLADLRANPAARSSRVAADATFSHVVDQATTQSTSAQFGAAIQGCMPGNVDSQPANNGSSRSDVMINWQCRSGTVFATIVVENGKITGVWWGPTPVLLIPSAG